MKRINILLILLLLLSACGGFQEAGKVLRNEKTSTTDEFLVKKRDPLILPPDYETIPEPNSNVERRQQEESNLEKIMKKTQEKPSTDKTGSSVEDSILKNIRK